MTAGAPQRGKPTQRGETTAGYCPRCGESAEGGHAVCDQALDLEPPRYCAACRRRMVVQVTPTGWTARCSEHGVQHG